VLPFFQLLHFVFLEVEAQKCVAAAGVEVWSTWNDFNVTNFRAQIINLTLYSLTSLINFLKNKKFASENKNTETLSI
jgi:hypothetical protein